MEYIEVIKINILVSFMYKWNLFITSLIDSFRFLAEYMFWLVVFITGNKQEMYGYTLDLMITYYIFMYIIGSITDMGNVGSKIAGDIKNGGLTNLLIKPISCFKYYFCESFGQKISQFVCSSLIFIPIFLVFYKKVIITDNLLMILTFVIALILAVILTYFINMFIGLLVFWLTEIDGLFLVKDIFITLLSGKIFPINIMPASVFTVLSILPFSYCTYFPISILIDDKSFYEIGIGIMIQIVWIIVFFIFSCLVWKKGIVRYEGTGM